jgi:hypothetical protein
VTGATSRQPEPGPRRAFDPEPWQALGINRHEGENWWRHRIEPPDALRWRRAGVQEPLAAARWRIAGVHPATVREWIYAEIDAGEAVVWAELGFDAARARVHKRAGRTPVEAHGVERRAPSGGGSARAGAADHPRRAFFQALAGHGNLQRGRLIPSYMSRQWFDDEAVAWAVSGFEAADAIAWKELGLTPDEAKRQQDQGANAMQTAKAWWRAGIPVDEVADWMGAGLTPDEARKQRADGVTVEQAAVLRSLRRNGRPNE